MKNRIEGLLFNDKLRFLMYSPEFVGAPVKLRKMLESLKNGGLKEGDAEWVAKAEVHIKNIDPHFEKMTVNGEEHEVFVVTRRK